jgi:hypothetical protein
LRPPNSKRAPISRPAVRFTSTKRTFQHDLLGGVHPREVHGAGRCDLHRPIDRRAIIGDAAQDHAVALTFDAEPPLARTLPDLRFDDLDIGSDLDVDEPDQALVRVDQRHVGRADLLAEDVDGPIADRHHVGNVG